MRWGYAVIYLLLILGTQEGTGYVVVQALETNAMRRMLSKCSGK